MILVTGCSGFIGSSLCEKLCLLKYDVVGVDIQDPPSTLYRHSNFSFLKIDLSLPLPQSLPSKVDFICHLAGQSSGEISFDSPIDDLSKNTVSTLNLIEYGLRSQCKKLFYASSMSVYGQQKDNPTSEDVVPIPISCYGISKLSSENYLRVYYSTLPSTSFRMFNVYGPGQNMSNLRQGMVSIFLAQALSSSHVVVKGSGDRFRDFIYIDDVVDIWIYAIQNYLDSPPILNLGTGIKTTVSDLLNIIKLRCKDISLEFTNPTPGDQNGIYADISGLQKFIGDKVFVPLDVGIKLFISSLRKTE